jgi:PIN domain nuclease of toxin-antitoxin system
MKLLLDTHIFIWWADQSERLSPVALSALEDEANELLLSVASVWEMQIKIQLGKLKLNLPLKRLLKNQQETNDLTVLPVTLTHALALDALPLHHKDPFDRLLIAQSIEEELTIVTADSQFSAYPVKLLQWSSTGRSEI